MSRAARPDPEWVLCGAGDGDGGGGKGAGSAAPGCMAWYLSLSTTTGGCRWARHLHGMQ